MTGVTRTLPMQAVFHGLKVNQTLTGSSGIKRALTGGEMWTRPMLRRPWQTTSATMVHCACLPRFVIFPRWPAFARHTIEHETTWFARSWAISRRREMFFQSGLSGQVIQKKQSNTDYAEFQPGDNVLAEVRLHFVVERYLDPGADGVYGNSANLGTDGVVGSYDDPKDDINHPFQPRYLYRVVSSEEVR